MKSSKICPFTFIFCVAAFGQTLLVRKIVREPSIAGMRPEADKISPDGISVVYLWNAEGREPKEYT